MAIDTTTEALMSTRECRIGKSGIAEVVVDLEEDVTVRSQLLPARFKLFRSVISRPKTTSVSKTHAAQYLTSVVHK